MSGERGMLIVIEGLDRSGKSTQCTLLTSRLQSLGYQVRHQKFPDRTTSTGKIIDAYLSDRSGRLEDDDRDHAIHLLFSANRWEASQSIAQDLSNGRTVLVDRYSFSGAVYSAAKGRADLSLEWAWAPEIGLPRPDLVFFLDVDEDTARERGGFGEERYEREEMQRRVRALYRDLWSRLQSPPTLSSSVPPAGSPLEPESTLKSTLNSVSTPTPTLSTSTAQLGPLNIRIVDAGRSIDKVADDMWAIFEQTEREFDVSSEIGTLTTLSLNPHQQ